MEAETVFLAVIIHISPQTQILVDKMIYIMDIYSYIYLYIYTYSLNTARALFALLEHSIIMR